MKPVRFLRLPLATVVAGMLGGCSTIGEPPHDCLLLPAAAVAIRNRDVEHVYRQDSDFQYLSGFPEPEAVIVAVGPAPTVTVVAAEVPVHPPLLNTTL